ncbi:MAG: phosphoglycerate kinase [Candidatus Moraniibacteriota bacterium]
MQKITDINLKDKKVIIRSDFNVGIKNGEITEEIRIIKALETIKHAKEEAECVMLVSHLGRPEGEKKKEFSLIPIKDKLEELLQEKIELVENIDDISLALAKSSNGKILLLENIRYWKQEKEGDEDFAQEIAGNFDVYVNDAFSASHRDHSSITKFPAFCKERAAGILFAKEFENLSNAKESPQKPAVAIIGGAKIKTKLPVIETLEKNYDYILVGGMTANEALDEKISFSEKVLLPKDFSPKGKEEQRLDIGEETVKEFVSKIEEVKTIIWNGPLGMFEADDCSSGTKGVIDAIESNKQAFSLIGGGETLEAVNRFSSLENFDYVSMSGGAMLEFLSGESLPGVEAIK